MTHTTSRAAWGVDGCKAGWFYFKLLGSAAPEFGLVATLAEVVERANAQDLILVDIPIGLPTGTDGYDYRECDRLARGVLKKKKDDVEMKGKRASSVFSAPVRAVLGASDYKDAQKRSLAATGNRSINKQAWAITPKIAEADLLLQSCEKAKRVVRETHPEVCFWAFGGKPMEHSKKKREGRRDRRKVLTDSWPDSAAAIDGALGTFLRREVAEDDILDAMACAVTAARILDDKNALRTLPAKPPRDSRGLPMEMVYAAPDS